MRTARALMVMPRSRSRSMLSSSCSSISRDGDRLALLEQTVGKGGFAVVNMCNNREIANLLTIFHVESSLSD